MAGVIRKKNTGDAWETVLDTGSSGSQPVEADATFREYVAAAAVESGWLDSGLQGVLYSNGELGLDLQTGAVTVAKGGALVQPATTNRERYFLVFPAASDITSFFAAPDGSNDRIDLVVAVVTDLATGVGALQVVEGVADPLPSPPATPDNAVPLWQVLIPANQPDQFLWTGTDVRVLLNAGFNGGTVPGETHFLGSVHCEGGVAAQGDGEDVAVYSTNQTRLVFQAFSDAGGDADDDTFLTFDAAGLTRVTRPALETATDATDVVTQFNLLRTAMIAAGFATDGDTP